MRLHVKSAWLIFLTLLASPSFASSFDTPESLIRAVYAQSSENYDFPYEPYLSQHLLGLFKAEREASPDEPSNLDWDPVIAGQDGAATDVNIGEPEVTGNKATVVVTFTNFDKVTLYYSLVHENGGWKIDDITNKDGEFPWSVSKQISGH